MPKITFCLLLQLLNFDLASTYTFIYFHLEIAKCFKRAASLTQSE